MRPRARRTASRYSIVVSLTLSGLTSVPLFERPKLKLELVIEVTSQCGKRSNTTLTSDPVSCEALSRPRARLSHDIRHTTHSTSPFKLRLTPSTSHRRAEDGGGEDKSHIACDIRPQLLLTFVVSHDDASSAQPPISYLVAVRPSHRRCCHSERTRRARPNTACANLQSTPVALMNAWVRMPPT